MAATAGSSSSPCGSFVEETLLLPTRNARIFAPVLALVFTHTLVFLAVAVLLAHPLAYITLASVQLQDGQSWWHDVVYAFSADKVREHAVALLLLYLAYLASKLATQAVVALAASATLRGPADSRPRSLGALFKQAPRGLFAGAALVAAFELASTAVPAGCLASWWSYRYGAARSDTGGVRPFLVQGVLHFLFVLSLALRLFLAAVFQVAIAASASAEEGSNGAVLRAWRFMTTAARWKEAAVLVFAATVMLPVATYPVYAFALDCAQGRSLFLLGGLHGFVLPSAGVQLYSAVAATMFYHRCVELHPEPAIPLTVKLAKLSETLPSPQPADRF